MLFDGDVNDFVGGPQHLTFCLQVFYPSAVKFQNHDCKRRDCL